jgi:hypothetical protein
VVACQIVVQAPALLSVSRLGFEQDSLRLGKADEFTQSVRTDDPPHHVFGCYAVELGAPQQSETMI